MTKTTTQMIPMLLDAVLMFFLFTGLIAMLTGIVLLVAPAAFERMSQLMSRRFSVRRAMKPLELPHYHETFFHRHHRWTGGLIVAGAIFFLFNLMIRFSLDTAAAAMPGQAWVWSAVLWTLVAGNALALVIGIIIFLCPQAMQSIEAVANRWISTRKASHRLEEPRDPIDRFSKTHPRLTGSLFVLAGAFLLAVFGALAVGS